MIIKQGLNNNVAFVIDDNDNELIVTGRGIAFGKHKGDTIDASKIEYYFPILPHEISERLATLLVNIPIDYYAIANDITDKAREVLDQQLNASIIIALTDHIYNSVTQKKKGIELSNPLKWDIQRIYPQEYSVGLFGLKLIKNLLSVELRLDEAATIALHIVNSESNHQNDFNDYDLVARIHWITKQVSNFFNIDFSIVADQIYYQRFITHIRFFVQRVLSDNYDSQISNSRIFEVLKRTYTKECDCVEHLSDEFYKKYGKKISKEERAFLILHIHNMLGRSDTNKEDKHG